MEQLELSYIVSGNINSNINLCSVYVFVCVYYCQSKIKCMTVFIYREKSSLNACLELVIGFFFFFFLDFKVLFTVHEFF